MTNPFNGQKHSVVLYWSFSYTIILLLSLAIMLVVYTATQKTIKFQSAEANEEAMSSMVRQLDNQIVYTASILYELQQNYTLIRLNGYEGDFSDLPSYELYEAYTRLGDAQLSLDFVNEMMVYYPRTDTMVSSATVVPADKYFQVFLAPKGFAYTSWRAAFENVQQKKSMALYSDLDGASQAPLSYLVWPHRNGTKFIAVIDPARLLSNVQPSSSNLYIVDDVGRFVAQAPSNRVSWEMLGFSLQQLRSQQPMVVEQPDGNDSYMVSCIYSGATNWYYIVATPLGDYYSDYFWVQQFTIIGIVFYLLAAVVIVLMSVRSHYRPIRQLVQDMESNRLRYLPRGNEYIFLSDSFAGLRKEQSALLSRYRDQEWCTAVMGRSMVGEYPVNQKVLEGLREYFSNSRIPTHFLDYSDQEGGMPSCYLTVFYICDYGARTGSEMRADPTSSTMEDYYTYSRMMLYRTLTEQFTSPDGYQQALYALHVPVQNLYISVIFTQVENAHQLLEDIAHRVCETVNAQVYMETRYVTGAHPYPLDQLAQSYQDLLRMTVQQEQQEQKTVSDLRDLPNREQSRPEILGENDRKYLERMIRLNNIPQLRDTLIRLFRGYTLVGTATILQADFLLFISAMANFSTELVSQMHLDENLYLPKITRCLNDVMTGDNPIRTLRRVLRLFQDISDAFCTSSMHLEETRQQRVTRQVRSYIQQNFHDPNLSLSIISNHFEMNAAQLSRIFRENNEYGIPDYINRIRIDHAKTILCSDRYTNLDDLATQVGYNNTKTLMRAFKRFESMTPGQYKELYRENNAAPPRDQHE